MDDQPSRSPEATIETFSFVGTTPEYFRVWIVSLCLTVVTLGIYSPWAKVRKRRYLYRSTRLAGATFDYHANPLVILRARLIALVLLAISVFGAFIAPGLDAIVFLLVMIAVPALIVRARMFNARYTSYRNLRFRFDPTYGEAYIVIFGYGLLAAITLGLAYPYARYRRSKMLIDNAHFGTLQFSLANVSREFYSVYLKVWGLVMLIGVLFAFTTPLMPTGDDGESQPLTAMFALVPVVLIVIATAAIAPAIARLTVGNTSVGEHRFVCDWQIPRLLLIYFTNLLAIALTLGLAIPWATIRLQRYQYQNLALEVHGDIDAVIAAQADDVSAMGEEIGDAFDIDLGL